MYILYKLKYNNLLYMNFDLDTSNYSKEDYYDIFNLDKSLTITESLINEKHET